MSDSASSLPSFSPAQSTSLIMVSTLAGAVALLIAGAAQAHAQACPPITTTIAGDAFGNNEASAGTSLVIPSYAPAVSSEQCYAQSLFALIRTQNTLYSCAQGFANAGATVLVAEPATVSVVVSRESPVWCS